MKYVTNLGIVVASAVGYRALFVLNGYLFEELSFAQGVDWIFLPGGLRLVLVLLFGIWGAAGIAAASVAGGLVDHSFGGDVVTATVAGIISGFAPLVARAICVERSMIRDDLLNLRASTLLRLVLVFSVTSALMHQVWYALRGVSGNFLASFSVMQMGDMVGSIIVLYMAKLLIAVFLYDNR